MLATQVFARFAHETARGALPQEVLHHAQRAVIDWYASLYPGLAMPAVQVLEATMVEDLDRGEARLALGRKATPRAAALINGTAAHAAEVDDSFRDAMYHPGCCDHRGSARCGAGNKGQRQRLPAGGGAGL